MDSVLLYPGSTIGIIGDYFSSTQLVNVARDAGLKIATYSSNSDSEIARQSDYAFTGDMNDVDTLREFAEKCDLVTYVSNDIDPQVISEIEKYTYVPQGESLLEISQDRVMERAFFDQINVNTSPYVTIINLEDIYQAIDSIGYPAILKPIQRHMVNNQQLVINESNDIALASDMLKWGPYILESYVPYRSEYSIIATKSVKDNLQQFPAVKTSYLGNVLQTASTDISKVDQKVIQEMIRIVNQIGKNVKYVGSFEVSFGVTADHNIYVTNIDPTVNNTGFLFNLATEISEYDQHLRAISGLPLAKIKKISDVVSRSFTKKQYEQVLRQRILQPNWQFYFNYHNNARDNDVVGVILIPTDSVEEAFHRIVNTGIWTKN
ncbi:ATP-grasp domain-containing protein [Fructilactobacillus fructivorans]|uniref:ATP-grasp domain-containing protein n=1 Tax=Fructilactobacillus fructivorans TaxID=1614 RepID=A0AAE6TVZ6_9LACO|nr:ATP-grasp domain-containing protein [Fructilactobacillus fructivorans]KRK57080.1 phosphoribosylaminoimidazole carboxylase, ATPase subunit [Fructilactobacillus fructivorans]QFX92431.1 ATP-grasp domain-containing protein [Fructilactobacillus fructivorans]RDV64982.1 ATP-grasp domain-containing protein [Fructilactobacillus fructivorans]